MRKVDPRYEQTDDSKDIVECAWSTFSKMHVRPTTFEHLGTALPPDNGVFEKQEKGECASNGGRRAKTTEDTQSNIEETEAQTT